MFLSGVNPTLGDLFVLFLKESALVDYESFAGI